MRVKKFSAERQVSISFNKSKANENSHILSLLHMYTVNNWAEQIRFNQTYFYKCLNSSRQ
jgi:hypothetical protein